MDLAIGIRHYPRLGEDLFSFLPWSESTAFSESAALPAELAESSHER
jgi:hypothetical protein